MTSSQVPYLADCVACDDGCKICEVSPHVCSSCKEGYMLNEGECVSN